MELSVAVALIPTSLYMVTLGLAGLFKSSNDHTRPRGKKNRVDISFLFLCIRFIYLYFSFFISFLAIVRCFPFVVFVWNTTRISDQSFDKQICYTRSFCNNPEPLTDG